MIWKTGLVFLIIGILILFIVIIDFGKKLRVTVFVFGELFSGVKNDILTITDNVDSIRLKTEEISSNIKSITNVIGFIALMSAGYSSVFRKNKCKDR